MIKRSKRARDLATAIELRPGEIWQLYGLNPVFICRACTTSDPDRFLPSKLIPGRQGRRGVRLINHDVLRRWMAKWQTKVPVVASPVASEAA